LTRILIAPLSSKTDADGRASSLLNPEHKLVPGAYTLRFETEAYHALQNLQPFFPFVEVRLIVIGHSVRSWITFGWTELG
jgi:5-hydroxyisourate hydrolase-like protein (transthyretin family)